MPFLFILIISFLIGSNDSIKELLLFKNDTDEYWRYFTFSFVHIDKVHLFSNLFFVSIFFIYFKSIKTKDILQVTLLTIVLQAISLLYLEYNRLLGFSGVCYAYFTYYILRDLFITKKENILTIIILIFIFIISKLDYYYIGLIDIARFDIAEGIHFIGVLSGLFFYLYQYHRPERRYLRH